MILLTLFLNTENLKKDGINLDGKTRNAHLGGEETTTQTSNLQPFFDTHIKYNTKL